MSEGLSIPQSTSAEAFTRYVVGTLSRTSRGAAWRDLTVTLFEAQRECELVTLPAVSEPFLAWCTSGDVQFQEREGDQPWITHRIRRGSFFLTCGGAPYDCRWKALSPETFETMSVFISLPLLERAMEEVFGRDAPHARLRDLSAFTDPALHSLMEHLHAELLRKKASPLLVQGLAQAITIHLARNYSETDSSPKASALMPGHKFQQITRWMTDHLAEDFDLAQLAEQASISKFHFHRLFKAASGLSPLQYHMNLRMDLARRLLRETDRSVMEVALEVGYSNPSHFTQLFRRENGLSPVQYRRKR